MQKLRLKAHGTKHFIKMRKLSSKTYAITCMLLCCLCYAIMNTLVKLIAHDINIWALVFYRNFMGLLSITPIILLKYKNELLLTSFNRINLGRGVGSFIGIFLWFKGMSVIPITEAVALSYLTPIFTSVLAILLMKEKPSLVKFVALLIGLGGTYIILSYDASGINIYAYYILSACMMWSITNIFVKNLVKTQSPSVIVFYLSVITLPISLPFLIANWYVPTLHEFAILLLVGLLSSSAQVLTALAYERAMITTLMPLDFSRIIFTAIVAYVMLGEIVTQKVIMGGLIIFAAGYLVCMKRGES